MNNIVECTINEYFNNIEDYEELKETAYELGVMISEAVERRFAETHSEWAVENAAETSLMYELEAQAEAKQEREANLSAHSQELKGGFLEHE